MRIKKMVNYLCITLSILLIISVFPVNFANAHNLSYEIDPSTLTDRVLTKKENSKIKSEIDILKKHSVDTTIIEKVDAIESGNEYTLRYKDSEEKVIIEKSDAESTIIICSDGKNTNVVSFENDGDIILDGFKVQISEPEINTNQIVPYGTIYKSVKSLDPYGNLKPSDYNRYLNSGTQNVALGKALDAIAATVLGSILSGLHPYVGITVSLIGVAANVKDALIAVNPKTQHLGIKWKTYIRGTDDYKYINNLYANKACTGPYETETSYEHFTIY